MATFDELLAEALRSTYGASQPNLRTGAGFGDNRSGGGRGTPGYPVPPEMEDGDEERFPFMKEDAVSHPGMFVGLIVPPEVAQLLAVEGGEAPEELHVTLYYGKEGNLAQRMRAAQVAERFFAKVGPIRAKLGGIGRFSASVSSDGKDVLYVSVDSPELTAFRNVLVDALKQLGLNPDAEHGFIPHITLKYLDQAESPPFRRIRPLEVRFSSLKVSTGEVVMEGENPLAKSPVMDDPSKDPNKGFSEWNDELVEAEDPQLPKGIAHLEDLKPAEFLAWLKKYHDLPLKGGIEVSEKVDGSARLTFGVENGKLWTQSKNGPRKFRAEEYGDRPMFRALRAAHSALSSKQAEIEQWWDVKGNDVVLGAEVLYTKIPNSIEYGPNVLMIHTVLGPGGIQNDAKSKAIAQDLLKATGPTLSDGKDRWKFEYKRVLDPKDVMVDVKEEFVSLDQIYQELRKGGAKGQTKGLEDRFKAVQLALKQKLLVQLRKQRSSYGPEGGDVEGLVFRDLESGALTKLVDRDYFSALNKFMWFYRELLGRGVKAGEKWVPGVGARLNSYLSDEVLGTISTKSPAFVTNLKKKYGEPKSAEDADRILAKYVEDNRLMQGDFLPAFRSVVEKTRREFEVVKKDWEKKRKGDITFVAKDGRQRKMDDLIKKRTDEAFADMEATLDGMEGSADALSAIKEPLTRRVAMLKVVLGQKGLEKLGGKVQESVNEGQHNFIDDADKVISKNKDRLEKRGIRVQYVKEVGSGAQGDVYEINPQQVIKVTDMKEEAETSAHLVGHHFKHIVKVFDVFEWPSEAGQKDPYYGVVMEKLQSITDAEVEEIHSIGDYMNNFGGMTWKQYNQKSSANIRLVELAEEIGLDKVVDDLAAAHIKYSDVHGGNFMRRANGDLVVIDFGMSSSPTKAVGKLERKIREAGPPPIPTSGAAPRANVFANQAQGQAKNPAQPPPLPVSQRKLPATGITKEQAVQIVEKNAQKLLKKGIRIPKDIGSNVLGEGTRGVAFDVGGGKVLKVTNDVHEAVAAEKLKGMGLKYVFQVFDVWRFPEDQGGATYGVLQEKLEPLDKKEANLLNFDLWDPEIWGKGTEIPPLINKSGYDWKKVQQMATQHISDTVKVLKSEEERRDLLERANKAWKNLANRFHIGDMVTELSSKGIKFHDYHAGNVMKRAGGDYVVIDIGYSKITGGKEPPVLERMVQEIASLFEDPVPNRLAAIKAAADGKKARQSKDMFQVVRDVGPLLQKHGWKVGKVLGHGAHGIAWDIGKNRVLKATDDRLEARSSMHIKGKKLRHVVHVEEVFKFPDSEFYGIIQEKLAKLSAYDTKEFQIVVDLLQACKAGEALLSGDYSKVLDLVRNEIQDRDVQKLLDSQMRDFQLPEMMKELHDNHIEFLDYHPGNIMNRGNDYVVIDLGLSQSPQKVDPPVLESLIGEVLREFNTGKNSSPDRQEYVGVDGGLVNHAQDGEMEKAGRNIYEAGGTDTVGVTIGRYQPFHRGHAEVIRNLARSHTKVIVLVAGNASDKKNPFSYETRLQIMKDSLPDVWRKLEVYKAEFSGKGSGYVPGVLSDIIKKGSPSLKGDTAVEILVGPDRLDQMKKMLAKAQEYKENGGETTFDPNLAVVKGLPGVKNDDDTDRISGTRVRQAIIANERDAVKKFMDPHLVSNPDQFEDAYVKMRDEIGRFYEMNEDLEEALKDVGGEGTLDVVLEFNKESLLRRRPISVDVSKLKKLGNGQDGVAYEMPDGKHVFKCTTDVREAKSSLSLVDKTLQHVVRIFDVFRFEKTAGKPGAFYGIVQEKLQPLSEEEKKGYDELSNWILDDKVFKSLGTGDINQVMKYIRAFAKEEIDRRYGVTGTATTRPATAPTGPTPSDQTTSPRKKGANVGDVNARRNQSAEAEVEKTVGILEMGLKKFQIDKMIAEVHGAGIEFYDYHSGNIMKRGTNYVITDLGRSNSRGGDPPVMEAIEEEILKEIGITMTPGAGPGSTQSGVRAGSSGWSSPQNMYTKDDVEAAQENPEEFEVWSDNLWNLQTSKGIGEAILSLVSTKLKPKG